VKDVVFDHICYEIVMSLGNSLQMGRMLKQGLTTYLRRLNCRAGLVLRSSVDAGGRVWFAPVYGIPRLMGDNPAVVAALNLLPEGAPGEDVRAFLGSLPLCGGAGDMAYHLMDLPSFGVLVLIKSGEPFGPAILRPLTRVNLKLGRSCLSCLKAGQAESTTRALEREVAERKTAEERYRHIYEHAVEGIFQTDLDGTPIRLNPAMADILGYESSEAAMNSGRALAERYVDPQDHAHMRELLLRDGVFTGFDVRFRRSDGSTVWATLSARLVRDGQGRAVRVDGMAEDVTARKHAELEMRRAKEAAEAFSLMQSNFLSTVSHELRTPLTSILGFSKLLLRQVGDCAEAEGHDEQARLRIGRIRQNLAIIAKESRRLTELINNVLDLSRLEAGRFVWHLGLVDLGEVLEHSLRVSAVLFENKGLLLTHDVPGNLPVVSGDRDRLVQVCLNLLSNAAKFTPSGGVHVSAECDGGMVRVAVRDSGLGIEPGSVQIIFDKFRQLGDTLTDKPRGSGLGLPICKEIVEHLGGRIGVDSAPGRGSTFWFTVPAARPEDPAAG
jgi:PAS domain S-box-containing protein